MNSATGFLMDFCGLRPLRLDRKESVRFPGEPSPLLAATAARSVSMIAR
jgi:hypothetical protein